MISRDQRLRKRADFDSVRARGKRVSDNLFVLTVARSEAAQTRWGLAVGRRVGNAVVRNRVKRKIRENIRDMTCKTGLDVIVFARPGAADAGSESFRSSLHKLARRAGLTPTSSKSGDNFDGAKS